MRCEHCRRMRSRDEPGWVLVVLHPGTRGDGLVALHYCRDHALQFNTEDPDVFSVES